MQEEAPASWQGPQSEPRSLWRMSHCGPDACCSWLLAGHSAWPAALLPCRPCCSGRLSASSSVLQLEHVPSDASDERGACGCCTVLPCLGRCSAAAAGVLAAWCSSLLGQCCCEHCACGMTGSKRCLDRPVTLAALRSLPLAPTCSARGLDGAGELSEGWCSVLRGLLKVAAGQRGAACGTCSKTHTHLHTACWLRSGRSLRKTPLCPSAARLCSSTATGVGCPCSLRGLGHARGLLKQQDRAVCEQKCVPCCTTQETRRTTGAPVEAWLPASFAGLAAPGCRSAGAEPALRSSRSAASLQPSASAIGDNVRDACDACESSSMRSASEAAVGSDEMTGCMRPHESYSADWPRSFAALSSTCAQAIVRVCFELKLTKLAPLPDQQASHTSMAVELTVLKTQRTQPEVRLLRGGLVLCCS